MKPFFKTLLLGLLSGLFLGASGLVLGFLSSGFFSPFSRAGVDVDYEASTVVFFSLGLCFGSTFGAFLSTSSLKKNGREFAIAFILASTLFLSLVLPWYFPIVSLSKYFFFTSLFLVMVAWFFGPTLYAIRSGR